MFEGIRAGREAAAKALGITSRVVVDFPRSLPFAVAEENLDVALRQRAAGVVGLDIAGDEAAVACPPRFAPLFARARQEGLHATAHAGEAAGPASVADAVARYGVSRIGHVTRAIEDPSLVARLAASGVVLEVCPSSNLALGVVADLEDHPVAAFVDAGVACVVATDDPTLFRTTLSAEFERLHGATGLSPEVLGPMAERGFEAAFVEPGPSGEALRERLRAHAADLARMRGEGP